MRRRALLAGLVIVSGCATEDGAVEGPVVFSAEEMLRIGSQLDGEAALTTVAGISVTTSEIFVLESQPARVAVFDRQGRWLRNVGGSGDGPGEFARPSYMGLHDDLLWVGDPRGGRVEFFSRAGSPSRSVRWSLPADSQGVNTVPIAVFSDASILAGPAGLPIGAAFRGAVSHRTYYRAASDLRTDPTELYVEPVVLTDYASVDVAGGRMLLVTHPHPQVPLVRTLPDGSGILVVERYVAPSEGDARFSVRVIAASGAVRSEWTVTYGPVSADGWQRRAMERMEEGMLESSGVVDRSLLSSIENALEGIDFYPPVTDAVAGSDGSIWLRREDLGAESADWQAFSGDGILLGTLQLPEDMDVLSASEDMIWAVLPDDLGVPFVVGLRVAKQLGGAP